VKSFYKGLKMALIATIASYGTYFFCYRLWKNVFTTYFKVKELDSRHIMAVTAAAGSTSSVIANPLWFINTRMTISKENPKGIRETIKEIYQAEGIAAFYKGVLPNMILVSNPIINFVAYEKMKSLLLKKDAKIGVLTIFIISSIAKTLATFATYPILTVRVRMHANKDQTGVLAALIKVIDSVKDEPW